MGADGGSIPRREELVKEKPKEVKPDPKEVSKIRYTLCAISKDTLKNPVVACKQGNLYNKEVVIKNLLDKTMPEPYSHIRSLKDIYTVNFKPNPHYNSFGEKKGAAVEDLAVDSPFVCPITGVEVGGSYKFSFIKSCGCAMSDRALKDCPTELCLVCNKPFKKEDIILLCPTKEELKEIKKKAKESQKEKKKDKSKTALEGKEGKEEVEMETKSKEKEKDKKRKAKQTDDELSNKKQNAAPSIDPSILKRVPVVTPGPHAKSEVYASLFTSGKKEKKPVNFTTTW